MLLIRTLLFCVCALSLMAQVDTEQPSTVPASEGYGGPAILSRGEFPTHSTSAPIAFRPFIGLGGIYDDGIVPVAVNSNGNIPTANLFGVELDLGMYGYHTWKRTTLSLDYRGNFRHYSQQSYDGSDQFISLSLKHQPSKRFIFSLQNTGGTYSRSYFLSSTLGPLDPNYLQIPANDIYDNRVVFLNTAGDMIYRLTSRLSFDIGGEGYIVRRASSALYGLTGYDTHADVQYRVRRHTTIGADYRFAHYEYTKGFGGTYIHSVGIDYAAELTRRVQLAVRIGGARVESLSLELVPLDPAIAALLGVSEGIQASHQLHYVPDVTARITATLRHSQLNFIFNDNVNPGNGVYLTSRMESAVATYSYTGVRHWNFGFDASYTRLSALTQTIGNYGSYGVGTGVTRDLSKGLHGVFRIDERRYDVAANNFHRNDFRVMVGLNFSPGDVPLALW